MARDRLTTMELFDAELGLDRWFAETVGTPTPVQRAAWPVVREGSHALIIAPTGQGKSLAAWRPLVERLCGHRHAGRGVRALHVAPLKALARDMTVNLAPLLDGAASVCGTRPTIALRCGDTPAAERARQRQRPPELLSTTPESLFVLLGSPGGRRLLGTVVAVVVDELHALIDSKRGAHLALSLARLDRLVAKPIQRIGLSATARPAVTLADFLTGGAACEVVEPAHNAGIELRVELPEQRLGPFPNTTHWAQIHARIAAMVSADAPDSGTPGAFASLASPGYAGDSVGVAEHGRSPGKRSAPGNLHSGCPGERDATPGGESPDSGTPGVCASLAYPGYAGDPVCVAEHGRSPGKRSAPGVHDASVAPGIPDACAEGAGEAPRSLLVFCQTRAQVERTAAALDELLSDAGMPAQVGAHHGSLDTSHREAIEARFKGGELRVLVSSASLELGLDLGGVDRVCQIGAPGSINRVRQRAGRSAHRPGGRPCMHLFPLTLNQLIEARALDHALRRGVIEATAVLPAPLDVLAQHLAAMADSGIDAPEALLALTHSAWPYRDLTMASLVSLLELLSEPVADLPSEQCRRLLVVRPDGRYAARPGAQRLVLTNAGTIPEFFEYRVVRADTGDQVGALDEEFAFESSPGQVVQLGRRAWRILRVSTGEVRVEPADQETAELPFWFGEGPGRSPELAEAMTAVLARRNSGDLDRQAAAMLAESTQVLGALPGPDRLVIERFPDPNGDRHVVLHTFAGARINRAWGLALRKRFCRQFNFELQAAATDDGILISLGVTSRFEPAEVARFVRAHNVADVLTQALLDTPLFVTRFRWAANNALVLLKNDLRGPVPAQRQRSQAENLIACVFPDQLACVENLSGPREVPDHPLVRQALDDCLNDYMDLPGLQRLLQQIESGAVGVHAVDLAAPSPLAEALIHAPRHSYLDEAAAEERRTRNFESRAQSPVIRRSAPARSVVVGEATPRAVSEVATRPTAEALERLLRDAGFLTAAEGEAGAGLRRPAPTAGWTRAYSQLVREKRAVSVRIGSRSPALWVSVDRLGWLLALRPDAEFRPWIAPALIPADSLDPAEAMTRLAAARRLIDGTGAGASVAGLFGSGGIQGLAAG